MYIEIASSQYLLGFIWKQAVNSNREFRLSFKKAREIFKKLEFSKVSSLEFHGFATSGGFDEDHPRYWVSNLYNDDGSDYCSRDNKNNINTAAVLKDTQNEKINIEAYNYILNLFKTVPVLGKSVYPPYKGKEKLSQWHIESLREIYLHYRVNLISFIAREKNQSEEVIDREVTKALDGLKKKQFIPLELRRRKDDPFVLIEAIDYNNAINGNKLAIINKVELSRQGNFTCPVECFMIFISETFVDIEAEDFNIYNDLRTLQQVISSFPGEIRSQVENEQEGISYAEFNSSGKILKPLIWGKFINRSGTILNVSLKERYCGNFLYVKLINPDNRMQEMNDAHDTTNIDCGYCLAFGTVIDLTQEDN